jgi:hypothetical protein
MYNIYYVTGGDIGTPELTNIIEVVKIKLQNRAFPHTKGIIIPYIFF